MPQSPESPSPSTFFGIDVSRRPNNKTKVVDGMNIANFMYTHFCPGATKLPVTEVLTWDVILPQFNTAGVTPEIIEDARTLLADAGHKAKYGKNKGEYELIRWASSVLKEAKKKLTEKS